MTAAAAPSRRLVAGIAMASVLLASADTYVIVLALPAIMADLGIGLDQLQQATPIVSGFLLGYVVVMPLLGRLSDVHGRRGPFLLCLVVFAAGSLVTASSQSLAEAVAGRALQGMGGGGLVPLTLAMVADWWQPQERGLPLGIAGGVQELGSVVGPLYGALILSLSGWRTIFWINLPLVALLLAGIGAAWRRRRRWTPALVVSALLIAVAALAAGLAVAAPAPLVNSVSLGTLYLPAGGVSWLTPLWVTSIIAVLASAAVHLRSQRRRGLLLEAARRTVQAADWPASLLVALILAAVVISFAAADPSRQALNPDAPALLGGAAVCLVLLVLRERAARSPLLPGSAFASPAAGGALAANLALGAALMAALVDVPILARATVFPDSQLDAALVLLRLLVALPIGAVLGGRLLSGLSPRWVAGAGLLLSTAAFIVMTRWSATTLADPLGPPWLHPSDPVLFACGLGFGLAIAPVNSSLLGSVRSGLHGLASSLLVVARMVGMLAGISVLTALGLREFYTRAVGLPSPVTLCPSTPLNCSAYNTLVTGAIVSELHTVFLGAAACAGLAALLALSCLRAPRAGSPIIASRA